MLSRDLKYVKYPVHKERVYSKTKHSKADLLEKRASALFLLTLGSVLGFPNKATYASKFISFKPIYKTEKLIQSNYAMQRWPSGCLGIAIDPDNSKCFSYQRQKFRHDTHISPIIIDNDKTKFQEVVQKPCWWKTVYLPFHVYPIHYQPLCRARVLPPRPVITEEKRGKKLFSVYLTKSKIWYSCK